MVKKRCASLLLAVLLTLPLAACGEDTSAPETTDTQPAVTAPAETTAAEDVTTELTPTLPAYDCKGGNLRLLTMSSGRWTPKDIIAEEITGETLNDAVFKKNSLLQQKYNCTITTDQVGTNACFTTISQLVQADDDAYDIIMPFCTVAAKLALEKALYSLNDIGNIDISKPWWSTQFTEDTRIGAKNYFLTGDVCETFMRATYAVFFNKTAIGDFHLDNPYELVKGGKWTYEKLHQMGTVYAGDLNGDAVIKSDDRVGLIIVANQIEALYCASGEKLVVSGEKGFSFIGDNERSIRVLENIYSLFKDKNVVLCISDTGRRAEDHVSLDTVVAGETAFSAGHVLFLTGTMNNATALRESDADFGIIPIPKAEEAQKDYYSFCNMSVSGCAIIPITVRDTAKSSILLEDMAYHSRTYYTPAYYETTLKFKASRDSESAEMLDLIYERRTADIGSLYSVGNAMTELQALIYPAEQNGFASFFASKKSAISATLDDMNSFLK
ncbi:MAG: hypothetical protein E7662_11560 [Ruminococcaceae bacterium]|nr:hypothetical protein [Oscillospiraceae bacterium]